MYSLGGRVPRSSNWPIQEHPGSAGISAATSMSLPKKDAQVTGVGQWLDDFARHQDQRDEQRHVWRPTTRSERGAGREGRALIR